MKSLSYGKNHDTFQNQTDIQFISIIINSGEMTEKETFFLLFKVLEISFVRM